ncbi:MAG: sensor histidine kinase [Allosphingosinicella sp.]|uniref:sensor histidine kinase n=1 Tax=Allosphingosinicella sp. TaxID=2823234 RepID=UPI003951F563
MARRGALWQHPAMDSQLRPLHFWIFCVAGVAIWLAVGWQNLVALGTGAELRGQRVPMSWLAFFLLFGGAMLAAMALKLRPGQRRLLLAVQLAAVLGMALVFESTRWSVLFVVTAWQAALAMAPLMALGWVFFQAIALNALLTFYNPKVPPFLFVLSLDFVLQLLFVFTAYALRREAETARELTRSNRELRSAQAVIASTARSAERLRISRELHDEWGHELTALGLQLEIASHVAPERASEHVVQAKGLAGALLTKVRDVVATLREDERSDLKDALEALARSVPRPVIHVSIAPSIAVSPDRAHALVRCAQEAVTNAVKHADAENLWLEVTPDGGGVRLLARDDGRARPKPSAAGSGLVGMRERLEHYGGRLAVRAEAGRGFTIDAWLPVGPARAT